MTQEQKDLLLRDLCARLPYGVRISYRCNHIHELRATLKSGLVLIADIITNEYITRSIENITPYLFPLSSMTDELWDKEFRGYCITEFTRDSFKYGCETLEFYDGNPVLSDINGFINSLIKNHFDIYGLIPMGLAIDATGLNIY